MCVSLSLSLSLSLYIYIHMESRCYLQYLYIYIYRKSYIYIYTYISTYAYEYVVACWVWKMYAYRSREKETELDVHSDKCMVDVFLCTTGCSSNSVSGIVAGAAAVTLFLTAVRCSQLPCRHFACLAQVIRRYALHHSSHCQVLVDSIQK